MIWDIDTYIIDEPGTIVVPYTGPPRVEYPVDLEYRARVKAIYQQMQAKQHERWLRKKDHGTQG